MECLNAQIFNKNYRTEFAYYQVRVAWVVYEGFLTQKNQLLNFVSWCCDCVSFCSRSLRRTWIISFTSVIRYYMKSRHVFKPTAYLKKFSILWVASWTLFIAIFRSLKWLITVLSCMITSRIEWRPLPQTWQCLLESLLVPGLLHMQVNWNNCFCHLQQG